MKKKILPILGLMALSLAACGEREVTLKDYEKTLDIFAYKDTVRIMQIADLHWSMNTDYQAEKRYITKLVAEVDPDIIISTGDNVLGGDVTTYREVFSLLDGLKNSSGKPIYWASVWGNHDRSGIYNPDFPNDLQLNYAKTKDFKYGEETKGHSFYSSPEDKVFGRSNFVFSLTDGSNTIWRLYGVDSNTDTYSGNRYVYDHIHKDQIEWFEKEAKDVVAPSLTYFHIPLWETVDAYRAAQAGELPEGTYGGEIRESDFTAGPLDEKDGQPGVYIADEKTNFFDVCKENGVKGIFNGHDHINDFHAIYKDVLLAYGIKSGNGLYSDNDMIGAAYMEIHKDGSFDGRLGHDFHHCLMTYDGVVTIDGGNK